LKCFPPFPTKEMTNHIFGNNSVRNFCEMTHWLLFNICYYALQPLQNISTTAILIGEWEKVRLRLFMVIILVRLWILFPFSLIFVFLKILKYLLDGYGLDSLDHVGSSRVSTELRTKCMCTWFAETRVKWIASHHQQDEIEGRIWLYLYTIVVDGVITYKQEILVVNKLERSN